MPFRIVQSLLLVSLSVNAAPQNTSSLKSECYQPVAEQRSLIRQAEKNKYTLSRVEFYGNQNTSDPILRRRLTLNEGNFFTRATLMRSLKRLSALMMIKPVRLSDVKIRLDDGEKLVDAVICLEERRP
jgi:outer membrane protein assembly factor BamA